MFLGFGMIVLSLLSVLGLNVIKSSTTDVELSRSERVAIAAFYTAEAGIEQAKSQLATVSFDSALTTNSGDLFNGATNLAGGTYQVLVTDNDDGDGNLLVDADNIIVATATGTSVTGEASTIKILAQRLPPNAPLLPGAISIVGEADTFISNSLNINVDGRDWRLTDVAAPTGPESDKFAMGVSNIGANGSPQTTAQALADIDADIASNQEANFIGFDDPNTGYTESIGSDDTMTSAALQAFVDQAKAVADTSLILSDVPTGYITGNTTGANNCLNVGAVNTCLGSVMNPKITYFNMIKAENGNIDRQVKFNGNIVGAGILIIEGNDLLLRGAVDWTGMIITIGDDVGAGLMGYGASDPQTLRGAFVVDDQDTDSGSEVVLQNFADVKYSSEAIGLATAAMSNNGALGPVTQLSWQQQ